MLPSSIDAGIYHYLLNGEPAGVEEHWERRQQPSGDCLVNSSRRAGGIEIAVTARLAQQRVEHFEVSWRETGKPEVWADYRLFPGGVRVNWSDGNGTDAREELQHETGSRPPQLFPLMRIFTGPLIAGLLAQGGEGDVILPFIADPLAHQKLLRPVSSQREARVLDAAAELDQDGERLQCRRCQYTGDQYGCDARFWLTEDNLLARYQWLQAPGQQWDVWLQRSGQGKV